MWHTSKEAELVATSSSSYFPEILLQKDAFNKKMHKFTQALVSASKRCACGCSQLVLTFRCVAASLERTFYIDGHEQQRISEAPPPTHGTRCHWLHGCVLGHRSTPRN